MSLWQDYSNATTATENKSLENRLVEQYTPLVKLVWKKNFSSKPFDDCYAEGLMALWAAIKSWKADEKIGVQGEKEWRNYACRAIWNGIAKHWRDAKRLKNSIAASNVEGMEAIVSSDSNNADIEARREAAEKELKEIFQGKEEFYQQFLEIYGTTESTRDGRLFDEWEKFGYTSRNSMRSSIGAIMRRLRDKQTA